MASDLGAGGGLAGSAGVGGRRGRTLCLEVVVGDILCAAEDFAPVVADGVDAGLDAEPAEVAFEGAGDVCLAAGWGVSGGGGVCAHLGGRR